MNFGEQSMSEQLAVDPPIDRSSKPGPHLRIDYSQIVRQWLGGVFDFLKPLANLAETAPNRGQIEFGRARADRIDPGDRVSVQQLPDEVLTTRWMSAPIIREHQ